MKSMTCKQLGGACDHELHAETFDEIAKLCREHVAIMFEQKSQPHLDAADQMKQLMQTPGAMEKWFEDKKSEFNNLPSH